MKIIRTNRKSIAIQIKRNKEVVVRAPLFLSDKKIMGFVEEKKAWINKKLSELQDLFVLEDGAVIPILGKEYEVSIGDHKTEISDKIYLSNKNSREELIQLLKSKVRGEIVDVLSKYPMFYFNKVRITSAKTRWGSCSSKGNLNFSWRLAFFDKEIVEYVVVHELCHLIHMNHSDKFWREVEKYCPNYKDIRKRLKNTSVPEL